MSKKKKQIRENFRTVCLNRDGNKCKKCDGNPDDVHHITDRTLLPNGGYVLQNGITLCHACHEKAEVFHSTGTSLPDWSPDDLYKLINSSYEKAHKASLKLES